MRACVSMVIAGVFHILASLQSVFDAAAQHQVNTAAKELWSKCRLLRVAVFSCAMKVRTVRIRTKIEKGN